MNAPEIVIARKGAGFSVSLASASYTSPHNNYFSAMAEALKLQRDYSPAVIVDRVAGGANAS